MALKKHNPMTNGQRALITIDRSELYKGRPEKTLTAGLQKSGGRNNHGRITTRHIGGGHKRLYRIIDFKRQKHDMMATIERLEHDPNRNAFIALIVYEDGEKSYILAPQRIQVGDKVVSGEKVDVKPGNAMLLKSMPVGTIIHNIEMKPGKGGQMVRSAGTYGQLIGRDQGMAQIRLSSGEVRLVPEICMASVGAVSNSDHQNTNDGKAGRSRWKGKRPAVRGVVMNPVDHPHGGGEGKTSGGRHPVSPWGTPTKGFKTRKNKTTDRFIVRRRKTKK